MPPQNQQQQPIDPAQPAASVTPAVSALTQAQPFPIATLPGAPEPLQTPVYGVAPQGTPTAAPVNAAATAMSAPTPLIVPAPALTPMFTLGQTVAEQTISEEELKRQAMLAMEGEAGKRQRELEEQKKKEEEMRAKLEFEKTQLEVKVRELTKHKEAFEIEWIKYNNQKQPLENQVQPIKAEEKAAEDEERKIEQDEAVAVSTPGVPAAKIQEVEQKRWTIQERRHHAEEQKWAFEKQIEQLKTSMDALGNEYRKILSDEDALKKSIRDADAAIKNLATPKTS